MARSLQDVLLPGPVTLSREVPLGAKSPYHIATGRGTRRMSLIGRELYEKLLGVRAHYERERTANPEQLKWTLVGIVAISLWSTAFAGARICGNAAGAMTSMGICFFVGGVAACSIYAMKGKFKKCISHPFDYYIKCGVPFVLYPVCLYLGFHLATTDTEIIVLTVINYLWPHLMSIFLIVFFSKPWKWTLIPGILGAVGMVFVTTIKWPVTSNPLIKMFNSMLQIWPAALSCFFAAFCWAFYSVMSSRYAQLCRTRIELAVAQDEEVDAENDGTLSAVPFLTAISGLVLIVADMFITEAHPGPFDIEFYGAMLYLTTVPICACRFAWDFAMAGGDMVILNTYSYLTPFLATFWNIVLLGTAPEPFAIIGSAGLAVCAIVVKRSILTS